MNPMKYDYKKSQIKFSDSKGRKRIIKFILDREDGINVFFADATSHLINEKLWKNVVDLVITHYCSKNSSLETALENLASDLDYKMFLIFTAFGNYLDLGKTFENIYDKCYWGINENGLGFSGLGSTVECAAPYMQFLQDFLKYNEISTIIDAGCGDWTFSQHINWEDRRYIGIDVAKSVIQQNQEKFSSPTISFINGDATSMELPRADLLICKDVLQHLPQEQVISFLSKISTFKYCLISNDYDPDPLNNNKQIRAGSWTPLDLTKLPFNILGTKVLSYPMPNSQCLSQTLCIRNP